MKQSRYEREKNNQKGLKIISDFNKGVFPISTNDTNLKKRAKIYLNELWSTLQI